MTPWNELAVFSHVVAAGGFSAAAKRLDLSKAAVSEHVRRLEDRLGVRLLNRNTRRVSLTAAGEACYEHSARLVEDGELAARSAVALHARPTGLLRLTAPQTFGAMHVAPAVASFLLRHPRLEVDLRLSAETVDLLVEKLDLAIRIGPLASSSLTARRLATVAQVVVAAPEYLRRRGIPSAPESLAQHDVLQFTPLGWGREWRLTGARGERRVAVTVRFASDSGEALLAAACAGAGLALLPDWMVYRELASGALVRVLHGFGRPNVPVHAVHPSAGRAPAKVRLFVDHLARHFGRKPYWEI